MTPTPEITIVRGYDMTRQRSVWRAAKGGIYITGFCDSEEMAVREADVKMGEPKKETELLFKEV